MRIAHVSISNFRGITQFSWSPTGSLHCLIGPGDSTKSTILQAIEYCLSPNWSLSLNDSDFYNLDVEEDIVIQVTIRQCPEELLRDDKFGLQAKAISPDGKLIDEPTQDSDELVLTVELRVDSSLEPVWKVVNDRNPEGVRISSTNRAKLGMNRLGEYVDRHLTCARGSALSALTGPDDSVSIILSEAQRLMRQMNLDEKQAPALFEAIKQVNEETVKTGVARSVDYAPGLDAKYVSASMLALHEGSIPLRCTGLGSRRLITLSIQRSINQKGGITLIDEVETALEPYRIRNLLSYLKENLTTSDQGDGDLGQVIMTSHSPIVAAELNATELCIVRNVDGLTQLLPVPDSLQAIVRSCPEALFARKVIVVEGKTEFGLLRMLDRLRQGAGQSKGFAYKGVVPVNGGGGSGSGRARDLKRLGYDVLYFADSDAQISPTIEELEAEEIPCVAWGDSTCTEERVLRDFPLECLKTLIKYRIDEVGFGQVRGNMAKSLGRPKNDLGQDLRDLCQALTEDQLRKGVGTTAKQLSWFKNIEKGQDLAKQLYPFLGAVEEADFGRKLQQIWEWADG